MDVTQGPGDWLTACIDALEVVRRRESSPEAALAAARRIVRSLGLGPGDPVLGPLLTALDGPEPARSRLALVDELLRVLRRRAAAAGFAPARLLIIEADAVTAKVITAALGAPGRELLVADSAAAAERHLQRGVSLVVLDLMLPDVDGRNLLVRLRTDPRTRTLPVIVVAERAAQSTQAECFALGADLFLEKPLDVSLLCTAVSARLERARELEREALRDPVTGLPNQAGFVEVFERVAALARRNGEPLSLAILDLDDFERVNGDLGRHEADRVLERVAACLAASLRGSDLATRWGGDEFVLLFPGAAVSGAAGALTKLQPRLARELADPASPWRPSFCAGVAAAVPGEEVAEAIAEADRVLGFAKRVGAGTVRTVEDVVRGPSGPVLLVEDDPITASVIRHRLEKDGLAVVHHDDGAEGFAAVAEIHPALILLDLKLPGIDGFEFLQRLRESRAHRRVPAAVVSSLGREEDVVRALGLGADDYIIKPFSTAELRARVHRLLRNRASVQGGDVRPGTGGP